jgi:hypothetical protein
MIFKRRDLYDFFCRQRGKGGSGRESSKEGGGGLNGREYMVVIYILWLIVSIEPFYPLLLPHDAGGGYLDKQTENLLPICR